MEAAEGLMEGMEEMKANSENILHSCDIKKKKNKLTIIKIKIILIWS